MSLTIERSPAKACWMLMLNGVVLATRCKKWEIEREKASYLRTMRRIGL